MSIKRSLEEENRLLKEELESQKDRIRELQTELRQFQNDKDYNSKTYALVDASPNSIFQLSKDLKIEFLNAKAIELLGLKDKSYIGKFIYDFVDKDVASDIQNNIKTVLESKRKVESVFSINNRYFKVVTTLINFEDKLSILIVSADITEQTNYATELKYNSQLLQKVYDESKFSLMVIDLENQKLISFNKTSASLFEFKPTESKEEIWKFTLNARKNQLSEEERIEIFDILTKEGFHSGETIYVTKSGKEFIGKFHASVFYINDKKFVLSSIEDVTDLRKNQNQLLIDKQKQKLQIEQSPLGYLEWNTNFEVAEWNPSAEKIFGYTKAEAMGKHASFIIQDSEKSNTDIYWNNILTNDNGGRGKYNNINKNGDLLFIEWYNTPLYDDKGKILGVSSLIDNVTEKVKAEKELKNKTNFLETIYEQAFDGIMLFKPNSFAVIACNKRTFELFEVDNLDELNILMPNARRNKQNNKERTEMFEKISEGEVHDKDIEFITYKDNSIWLNMLVKLIEYDGETVELVRLTDVSQLKVINSKLNLDRQKQKIQVEQSPLGYIEWNTKFEVAEWNPSAERIFGYKKQEVIGKNAKFLLPESEKKNTTKIWQTILSYHSGHKGVYKNINKNNEIIDIEWYDTPLFDENGNVLGVSSLLIDITNKIKDEEELKYKTKFLETIYEEAFDGIMLFKPNSYEVINCNKRAFQIFETSDLDQLNEYLPNARKNKQTQKERDEIFNEISDGKIYEKEIEFVTYKGNTVWLTMLVKLINLNNTELELVLVTDVSVLKKINSKLNLDKQKQILHVEQSPIGYIEWNTDFEVVEWNPSAEIIFGYTKEEALGRNAVFIIPDEVKPLIDEVWNSLKSKNGGFRSTNENITKSNEIVTLEWYNTPLFDDKGNLLGVSSLIENITTEIKSKNEIEKQLKEKEILLSEIHHRVKNNLAIISGLLYMHSEHIQDESVKQILKESQSRIKSMAIIHEQLYQTENFGNINVNEYLKELIKKIASSFNTHKKKIDIDIDVASFTVPISQALTLGLVINELVINSYKYAFENVENGKIKVRFEKKGKHILRVSDNGIGYAEDFNFEKSSSLGINLVKILAKQLKGDVLFENKKGASCTLIF